jgi:hypothetical protein
VAPAGAYHEGQRGCGHDDVREVPMVCNGTA